MADDVKDGRVSVNAFSTMVGVTPRMIQLMCKDGSIPSDKIAGQYMIPFPKGLQAYIQIYKDRAEGRGGADVQELERRKLLHETELKESKAKLAKLEFGEKAGELHSSEIVEEALNDFVFYVRGAMLSLPSRLAQDVITKLEKYFGEQKPSASELSSMMNEEISFILQEFGNYQYSAEKMEQKRKEHEKGQVVEEEDD